ncbi:MAG TPA: alpha/beta hydrolase-fold protein [Puia sp.]|nr:alpha/beta hydrolase-fold protein [Puia sp.]
MKIILSLILWTLIYLSAFSQYRVRINLISIPDALKTDSIFIAGSFNNWSPNDGQSRFIQDKNYNFYIEFPHVEAGSYEFKFTRGSWQKAECKKDGNDIDNRSAIISSDTIFDFTVQGWKDQFPGKTKLHTASKNVEIIDSAFYIPQLQRYRRIWAYLPSDYKISSRRYPVLYMQDGQNLFDEYTAAYGEWSVDEILDTLSKKTNCIVIGIDNGADKRMGEYNPYDFRNGSNAAQEVIKGEGDGYVDFLALTLKPYIDKKFRTLPNPRHSFIAGSSMGGLISLYAIMKYPNVFGGAGVFSPAFWTSPRIEQDVKKLSLHNYVKMYFYAGGDESKTMVSDMRHICTLLKDNPKIKMQVHVTANGKHNEANWRREFPKFYEWMVE